MSRGLIVALLLTAAVLLPSLPVRPAAATSHWAPLLTCPDVDGTGGVTVADILVVVGSFGADYPEPDYMYLYDLNADGVGRVNDILMAVSRFGESCPLVDTQVAQATLAVERYRDQSVAIADGFVQGTQNLAGHGVHWIKGSLMDGVLDLTQPEGLNYTLDGELLAVYYVDPMWLAGHELEPEGFDGPEDNDSPMGWHDHPGLCVWNIGTPNAFVNENVLQADCTGTSGVWFESFGWMLHLWNFLPNPMGRFEMENPDAG